MNLSKNYKVLTALLLLFVGFSACAADQNPKRNQIDLKVGSVVYKTELARTDEETSTGLMYRKDIGPNEAMLFIFDLDRELHFWMKNVTFDLSIAYIDSSGVIREIHDMYAGVQNTVNSEFSARYALEVKKGSFAQRGVKVGDKIDLRPLH